jgi:hypothetical protein
MMAFLTREDDDLVELVRRLYANRAFDPRE